MRQRLGETARKWVKRNGATRAAKAILELA